MTDCIFCKIINKEIPSYKVYEDEEVYAFLDLSQVTLGHTLVIPKKHVADIFDYQGAEAGVVFAKIPKIARAMEHALPEMQGMNIVNNNKELAYQTVFHSHLHLVPRYTTEDDFSIKFKDNSQKYSQAELQALASKLNEQVMKDV
ncbi:HIT family protein [Vagococcus coleopterorum]|uniref:HIT family protein n=1 Tax=Vagococcus coleopterorum TaxID=2714946 RepID=A0A6G8AL46_9ENTE|nr:HIT family protein [Vagococcus coleopterorum]QIL45700.1 HIT family protein [Vagococcus coleopterorum]